MNSLLPFATCLINFTLAIIPNVRPAYDDRKFHSTAIDQFIE